MPLGPPRLPLTPPKPEPMASIGPWGTPRDVPPSTSPKRRSSPPPRANSPASPRLAQARPPPLPLDQRLPRRAEPTLPAPPPPPPTPSRLQSLASSCSSPPASPLLTSVNPKRRSSRPLSPPHRPLTRRQPMNSSRPTAQSPMSTVSWPAMTSSPLVSCGSRAANFHRPSRPATGSNTCHD